MNGWTRRGRRAAKAARIGGPARAPSAPGSTVPGTEKPHVERRKATRSVAESAPRRGPTRAAAGERSGCAFRRSTPSHFPSRSEARGEAEGQPSGAGLPRAETMRRARRYPPKSTNMKMTKNTNETTSEPADEPPADIDAMRTEFARRISRFVGDRRRAWRDCKEPACRRHRCCRAPRIQCSNAPPPSPIRMAAAPRARWRRFPACCAKRRRGSPRCCTMAAAALSYGHMSRRPRTSI